MVQADTDSQSGTPQSRRHLPVFAHRIKAATAAFADFLVPPACLACREPVAGHDTICATCWSTVSFIRPPLCDRLGIPMPFDTGETTMISARAAAHPPPYDRARAAAAFDGVVREMILQFKYGDTHNARKLFGRWLASAGADLIREADVIVPVPMHRGRLLARRFNQSAILARELSRVSSKRYAPSLIIRKRATTSQVGLSAQQRRRNLAGAFAAPPRRHTSIEGRNVLLIDDVITTGTTLNACTRTLRRAGAARIDCLAIAMVTDDSAVTL